MSDVRTVAGTAFTFPDLPPRGEVDPAVYDSITGRRAAVVAAAGRQGGRTCAAASVAGSRFRVHTCANPAACRLASLTRPASWSGIYRPGDRVSWNRGSLVLTGEVWALAPEPGHYWVLLTDPSLSERRDGCESVHGRYLGSGR